MVMLVVLQKSPDFIENYGNNTNCLGELNVLKGNKNIFTNVSSVTWDWGDGIPVLVQILHNIVTMLGLMMSL